MLAMLNTADVCVNPDVANEMNDISTMNKVMEYMALGKPMVQFDLAEGRFSAQQASLYARRNNAFDLAEKIVELLDNAGEAQEPWVPSAAGGCSRSSNGAMKCPSSSPRTRRSGRRQHRVRRRPRPRKGTVWLSGGRGR